MVYVTWLLLMVGQKLVTPLITVSVLEVVAKLRVPSALMGGPVRVRDVPEREYTIVASLLVVGLGILIVRLLQSPAAGVSLPLRAS